ncbi:MAG: RNA polymerase sigma factor RpoD/SigA [Treponema sp.]|jgi:RNA polymerase primary sigma factor|nr:RNA polymerase sigma factor RpoD/SigA [Treponema sp.]
MRRKDSESSSDPLEAYFRQIKVFPLLTFEDELELSKRIKEGSVEALHKLINSNLRLVVKIAGLYSLQDVPVLDIIQEGNLGLIHAAERYDYSKKVRFCTYASWWIRQYISRFISNKRRIVRLPLGKEEAVRKINHTYHVLSQTLMHQPQNSDIARELGISVKDVDSIVNLTSDYLPLEQNSDDYASCAIDFHEDYTYSPERTMFKKYSGEGTMRILDNLMDRERRIINCRYQLDGCKRRTLKEIGDELDLSPETVRKIERNALKKIRSRAGELREYMYYEAI